MKHHLHTNCCLQTTSVEAGADLCLTRADTDLGAEHNDREPRQPRLVRRPIASFAFRLDVDTVTSGRAAGRKNIQSPKSTVRLSSTHSIRNAPAPDLRVIPEGFSRRSTADRILNVIVWQK